MLSSSSSRLSILAFVAFLSTVAVAKPYAPDLYSRSALAEDNVEFTARRVSASRPYAPELYSRGEMDPINSFKRSIAPNSSAASSWSPLSYLSKRSEEEMHSRGKVDDSIIEKRGLCTSDSDCGSKYYCSSIKNRCYKKISLNTGCSRDASCASGFCSKMTNLCRAPRSNGVSCPAGRDVACSSGYCSVKTNTCRAQAGWGESCLVDAGCLGDMSCLNGQCLNVNSGSSSTTTTASNPSPSGSATQKRSLSPA